MTTTTTAALETTRTALLAAAAAYIAAAKQAETESQAAGEACDWAESVETLTATAGNLQELCESLLGDSPAGELTGALTELAE